MIIIKSFILKLFFTLILTFSIMIKNAFSNENYVVSIVNKMPITKIDIINRAKLIAYSIDKNMNFKNLNNYFSQSLKTLINEKIIFSAGNKLNKNLENIVSQKANKLLLNEFENSELKLNEFIKNSSIPKSVLLEKYKSQLIWSIVIKNKYKLQFSKLEKNIDEKININKKKLNEDLYDLAEIVIEKKNSSQLIEKINSALQNGVGFQEIAKQVSISSSAKFNGKIGWRNYQSLPNFIKKKKVLINEGDIFSIKDKKNIKIIKVLVKRFNGKLSSKENIILLAEIKFLINFQKKKFAYLKVNKLLNGLLFKKNNCKTLNELKNKNLNLNLKIIKSRIADLNPKVQNIIKNIKFFVPSQPIFYGNNGYTYIKCDMKKVKLDEINYDKLKDMEMNKNFLILSERLIKRLNKEANISMIEEFK